MSGPFKSRKDGPRSSTMQPRAFAGQGRMDSASTDKPLARLEALRYLIAPAVKPRTNWRETIMLKMITGKATSVPVAMI